MAKVFLKNTAPGARGIRNEAGEVIMIDPGQTVEVDGISDSELKDAKALGIEKGSKSDAAEASGEEVAKLGEPGPGDPPVPSAAPENEVVEEPAADNRAARRPRG